MKSVILIRHVKSDWSNLLPDFDRPIRQGRKEDAKQIAKEIDKRDAIPQYIISSPAKRAVQTTNVLSSKWDFPKEKVITVKSLYECTSEDIMAVITRADEKYDAITIVGHNPAITDFVNRYSNTRIGNVPTSGAIQIAFEVKYWKDINGGGKVNWFLSPKEL